MSFQTTFKLVSIVDDLINIVETELNTFNTTNSNSNQIEEKSILFSNNSMIKQKYGYLFDVAANLAHFSNVDNIINKAISHNVSRFFLGGYTLQSNYDIINLCNKYPNNLYCGIGIHPYNVNNYDLDKTFNEISSILYNNSTNKNIVIIGETGLDYSDNFPDSNIQKLWFNKHIEIAQKLNMKLYLHERYAYNDLCEILLNKYKFNPSNVLIHCFTGNENELLNYIKMGFNISISGFITKKKHGKILRNIIHHIPLNQLMIETDAPYMLITDKRIKKLKLLTNTKENEPCVLPFVLEAVHKCYNDKYSIEEIAKCTTENALKFFEIN